MMQSPNRLMALHQQISEFLRSKESLPLQLALQVFVPYRLTLTRHERNVELMGHLLMSRRLDDALLRYAGQLALPHARTCKAVVMIDEAQNSLIFVRENIPDEQSELIIAMEQLLGQMGAWENLLMNK